MVLLSSAKTLLMIHPDRVKVLRGGAFSGSAVLYWMIREKRSFENWSLLAAQNLAIKNRVPLYVCFQYVGIFPDANVRQYSFLFKGLKETQTQLHKKNISFFLLKGKANVVIPKIVSEKSIGTIFVDYTPLKIYKYRIKKVLEKINIPFFQVDAHNIVPVWIASNKKEFAAYTIRKKINSKLDEYLVDYPNLDYHPYGKVQIQSLVFNKIMSELKIDKTVKNVDWLTPGEISAKKNLKTLKKVLVDYNKNRNDPTKNSLSNLSPYFHFGHISAHSVALEITRSKLSLSDKVAFLEELIIRKELADNFCEYEKNYDYFEGFHSWAQKTLNEHRKDERDFLYTLEQFEAAATHDLLWNAAQNQMKFTGKMHGYMRMYWAKKILEWSPNPEVALQIAIELNDKYELDGRDPKGYTGIAWSIGGVHDRAWFDRPVYGKIRYMNYNGCKSKFDVHKYINMYSA